jgi:hypothetical protein
MLVLPLLLCPPSLARTPHHDEYIAAAVEMVGAKRSLSFAAVVEISGAKRSLSFAVMVEMSGARRPFVVDTVR